MSSLWTILTSTKPVDPLYLAASWATVLLILLCIIAVVFMLRRAAGPALVLLRFLAEPLRRLGDCSASLHTRGACWVRGLGRGASHHEIPKGETITLGAILGKNSRGQNREG